MMSRDKRITGSAYKQQVNPGVCSGKRRVECLSHDMLITLFLSVPLPELIAISPSWTHYSPKISTCISDIHYCNVYMHIIMYV